MPGPPSASRTRPVLRWMAADLASSASATTSAGPQARAARKVPDPPAASSTWRTGWTLRMSAAVALSSSRYTDSGVRASTRARSVASTTPAASKKSRARLHEINVRARSHGAAGRQVGPGQCRGRFRLIHSVARARDVNRATSPTTWTCVPPANPRVNCDITRSRGTLTYSWSALLLRRRVRACDRATAGGSASARVELNSESSTRTPRTRDLEYNDVRQRHCWRLRLRPARRRPRWLPSSSPNRSMARTQEPVLSRSRDPNARARRGQTRIAQEHEAHMLQLACLDGGRARSRRLARSCNDGRASPRTGPGV